MPDLITDAVIIDKDVEDEDENAADIEKGNSYKIDRIETNRPVFSSKNMRIEAKTYNFNDRDEDVMMASSKLDENLIRSLE